MKLSGIDELGIKVAIIGDQTGTNDILKSYKVLQKGIQYLKKIQPDVVIHVGDMIESKKEQAEVEKNFKSVVVQLEKLGVPWYLTAGDHDVNPKNFVFNSPDHSKEKLFQSLYSKNNPKVEKHLYYSFDIKNYHFISLYSLEHLCTDSRWGNTFSSEISDTQYNWLKGDLEANENKVAIIVFLHQPMWYNWSGWKRVHGLLGRYPVVAVIAGHFHYNQDEETIDGIRYLVVGATGATLKDASQNAGGIHHVTLMTIKDKAVDFTPIPLGASIPMKFTARVDMDRVQALDLVLGNLWDFESLNAVYINGNKLLNYPNSPETAQIRLVTMVKEENRIGNPIGNPIDVPVKFNIDFSSDSPSIKLVSSDFANDIKDIYVGGVKRYKNCVLRPSYRMKSSSNSSVEVSNSANLEPFWTGTLRLSGSPPPAGTKICFKFSMSFTGSDNEVFTIYRTKCIELKALKI